MVYGGTRAEAVTNVKALALHVIADRLEHGEPVPDPLRIEFQAA
jgi:predicted RNase H-like HicB family nuclease